MTGFVELYLLKDLNAAVFTGILREPVAYPELVRGVATLAKAPAAGARST